MHQPWNRHLLHSIHCRAPTHARGVHCCCPTPQVAAFTQQEADSLRRALLALRADAAVLAKTQPAVLKSEARRLGDEVLELERFVQLNQVGS